MITRLFNSPHRDNKNAIGMDSENAIGIDTIGSSESIMLAGLAFKKKWENKRKVEGKPFDNPIL